MAAKTQTKASRAKKPTRSVTRSAPAAGNSGQSLTPVIQGKSESTPTLAMKNFRNHPDMENFYRFIHGNDLRIEAHEILKDILVARKAKRKSSRSKKKATKH